MKRDTTEQDRFKLFTRRAAVIGGIKGALLTALLGRLYYLQVVEADRYTTLADENRINFRLLPPPRGTILDRFGRPLAVNRKNYRVVIVREQAHDPEEVLDRLSTILPLTDRERKRITREMAKKRSFMPVTVRENLTWEQVAQIEVNSLDLPGVSIDVGLTRFYPVGEEIAHLLGYVAAVSEAELTGDPLLELPGFRIGKAGIERTYDLALRGKAGSSQVEVNAFGRVIQELERDEGLRGQEVQLTIDIDLQTVAMKRMAEERSASCVVMDVQTGDIVVMASVPSFDPNAFARGLAYREWQALVSSPLAPMQNKSTNGLYHPGSVIKMVVAHALLDAGQDPRERIFCPGHYDVGEDRFHCWKRPGHGHMSMTDALVQSCDVYFYEMSLRIGIDRIAAMANRFTLGGRTGVDLPGEADGVMPNRAWKAQAFGRDKSWRRHETVHAGIGQGYVLTTPAQLCAMVARMVNGGQAVVPHLATKQYSPEGTAPRPYADWPSLGLKPEHLKLVKDAMDGVVNHAEGTAFKAKLVGVDAKMGGKTGTAQVRRITMAEREKGVKKNDELPWEERDHALFVGYAPTDVPRYAIAVVVEHGGGGGSIAAPMARDIMTAVLKRDPARDPGARNLAAMPQRQR